MKIENIILATTGLIFLMASIIMEDDRLFRMMVLIILFAIYIKLS